MSKVFKSHGVTLPHEFVDALDKGKLIIFAGAGVSSAVGYPDFNELVRKIRKVLEVKSKQKMANEIYLQGIINENNKGKVYRAVYDIFQNSKIKIKEDLNHRILLELFQDEGKVKIITVNYDMLFQIAASLMGWKLMTYSGGSGSWYPTAENLNGITHLHGCLQDGPDSLIFSHKDYTKAYGSSGHVKVFLESVLEKKYTLAFIGYSHQDYAVTTVLSTHKLNHEKKSTRPLFTFSKVRGIGIGKEKQDKVDISGRDGDPELEGLGFTPIRYPETKGRNKKHNALWGCLSDFIKFRNETKGGGKHGK